MAVVWIDDVLAAGVGDGAVDDGEFAVIADIESCQATAKGSSGEHGDGLDAGGVELGGEAGAFEEAGGAGGIGEEAAGDASFLGAEEGLGDAVAGVIGGEDVKEKVDVFLGGVDVGDELGEGGLGVIEDLDAVAGEDVEAA